MKSIRTIGVLTSGGDAPGMNAAIRAVVRTALFNNINPLGILRGYEGLVEKEFVPLTSQSVTNIIQKGGTILKTARSEAFRTAEGMEKAYNNLKDNAIDALVVIGGDGTFSGAEEFGKRYDFPVIGLPGTIDNDLYGTDYTIGYDTALNTVVQAVDKIKDTAESHDRLFFIEVMGRDAGFIALLSGIAGGAHHVLVPETKTYLDNLIRMLEYDKRRNKSAGVIIVAEGDDLGGAYEVAAKVKERYPEISYRVTILGHLQRGGSPSAMDRVLASELGHAAVNALIEGEKAVMVGKQHNELVYTPFSKATKQHNDMDYNLLEMTRILAL